MVCQINPLETCFTDTIVSYKFIGICNLHNSNDLDNSNFNWFRVECIHTFKLWSARGYSKFESTLMTLTYNLLTKGCDILLVGAGGTFPQVVAVGNVENAKRAVVAGVWGVYIPVGVCSGSAIWPVPGGVLLESKPVPTDSRSMILL